jgi:hypothetical protein
VGLESPESGGKSRAASGGLGKEEEEWEGNEEMHRERASLMSVSGTSWRYALTRMDSSGGEASDGSDRFERIEDAMNICPSIIN